MGSFTYGLLSILFACMLLDTYMGHAIEPVCTKFPYEEALLEKMVRMEFTVEKMADNIKEIKSEVKQELEKLKSERELTKRERDEFSFKIKEERNEFGINVKKERDEFMVRIGQIESDTKSKFSVLKKDVKDNLEHAENVITRMSDDLKKLKNSTIQDIKDSSKRSTVLFRVKSLDNLYPSQGQKLLFKTVLENHGDGYNNNTGVFTAPVEGQYLFSVQLCSSRFYFAFMQDGEVKQPVGFDNDSHGCGTSIFMTKVIAKTQIWIESILNGQALNAAEFQSNVFNGILYN